MKHSVEKGRNYPAGVMISMSRRDSSNRYAGGKLAWDKDRLFSRLFQLQVRHQHKMVAEVFHHPVELQHTEFITRKYIIDP